MARRITKKLDKKKFKRKLKSVKASEWDFGCQACLKHITPGNIFVVDTRNGKYCVKCSLEILDYKIKEFTKLRNEIRDKSMLNELEEEGGGRKNKVYK